MFRLARRLRLLTVCAIASLIMMGGCATTGTGDPRDPFEPMNRAIYTFNDGVDTVLIKPIAIIYDGLLPPMVRTGISNVFANINDVVIGLNNLLQGKGVAALNDLSRVMFNTTIGLFGLIDVATDLGIEKNDEDFGQTMGYWGVGDGPYLVLPFIGPRTLRDTFGWAVDIWVDPLTRIDEVRDRNSAYGLRFVSRRAELLSASKILEVASIDDYAFLRDAYLQRRRNLIFDGNPPRERDDGADAGKPATRGVNLRPTLELGERTVLISDQLTPAEEAILQLQPEQPEPAAAEIPVAAQPAFRVWVSNPR
jgi:phospholipid-binding lipoprotein MlaA